MSKSTLGNSFENCGLSNDVIEKITSVFSDFPEIDKVVLYGSRAKGNYKNGSDIDLTIVLKSGIEPTISLLNKVSLKLDDLDLIYTLDLSLFEEIKNQDLLDHINRVGKVFYSGSKCFTNDDSKR